MSRVYHWDGLRGLAATLVVLHHLMIGFYPSTYTLNPASVHTGNNFEFILHNSPIGIVINGGFAVALFLLLSGYVINYSQSSISSLTTILKSIAKRFFRFFPPLLAVNLIAWLVITFGWSFNLRAATLTGSDWWLGQMWQMSPNLISAFNQSWLSLFAMFPLNHAYNSSAWTMQYFFLGPIALSTFLFFTKKLPKRNLILAISMIFFLKNHYWLIILGYLLAQVDLTKLKLPQKLIQFILLLCLLLFANYPQVYSTALVLPYSWLPVLKFAHTSEFYHSLAAISLMLLVSSNQFLQQLLSGRLFRFLGTISFSLYLSHLLIINSLTSFLFLSLYQVYPYSLAFIISLGLSLVVIFILAKLIYSFVEKPFSKMIK